MKKVLLPGSYDPITRGHIEVARRALRHFDEVHVVVFINPNKKTLFTPEERLTLLRTAFEGEARVKVGMDMGLVADYAKRNGITLLLKGAGTVIATESGEVYVLPFATSALAKGGSGDVLAGIVAAMFASPGNFDENATAAERLIAAVVWHGNAARKLADEQGERCADISALPEFLGKVSTL